MPCDLLAAKRPDGAQELVAAVNAKERLLATPKLRDFRHNWLACAEKFERVSKRHTAQAAQALYLAGDLYLELERFSGKEEDAAKGVDCLKLVLKKHPGSEWATKAESLLRRSGHEKARFKKRMVEKVEPAKSQPSGAIESEEELDRSCEPPPQPARVKVAGRKALVSGIRSWSNPNYTRVVIDASDVVRFEGQLLKQNEKLGKPRRLFIDIKPARKDPGLAPEIPVDDVLLSGVRSAQYDRDTVRVVLDLKSLNGWKIFSLPDPFRIVVDITGEGLADKTAPSEVPPAQTVPQVSTGPELPARPEPAPSQAATDIEVATPSPSSVAPKLTLAEQLGLKVRRVVIDAGHGGKDPGACSPLGLQEKEIVLAVSKELAKLVRKDLGCEAILTRETDVFIPLEERTAIANARKGDLFVSVHANACRNGNGRGIETYFLSFTSDEESMRVAARENATTARNLSDLQLILRELMLQSKITESSRLAQHVQEAVIGHLRHGWSDICDKGVKKAPFYVLIGAQMPSILVEISFITNPVEAKRLTEPAYQRGLAEGILSGIRRYVEEINMAAARR